jgi:uncharacterized protein (DUF2236 family)
MFGEDSEIRRVHRERVVHLHGPRALLMQAAHPVAFAAFYGRTGALDDPYGRLERTARVMDVVYFGTRADAQRATRRVRALHRRAGVDRPDLLLWVLASLADSAIVVHERYVGALDREAYWADMRVVGRLFGLRARDLPADLQAYVAEMLDGDVLAVSARARELALQVVLHPPVPLLARPLLELVDTAVVGLLPPRLRRAYGLSWDPARGAALWANAAYVRRVLLPLLPPRVRWTPASRAA